jgi:hypothetical protein
MEESQHIKTDVLEIERLARAMNPSELVGTFDDILGLAGRVDAVFVGQVEQEIATFERSTGRVLAEPQTPKRCAARSVDRCARSSPRWG